ncbi:hypothetical protein [Thermoflavimicrobium dichotomicum]|uniref:Uncharacterized protein n=1 Tax=Thermoflavimicrobium dichotomicum TaxID=46223 RepID=A0A1I3P788_9BACL|nr:hypothetical protein [Thermoflavimicrobium dichotomicum]SFJ16906.1 hypothetical protein SAMN05421852_105103 [Thermoflavimicrobium dichotomicum]
MGSILFVYKLNWDSVAQWVGAIGQCLGAYFTFWAAKVALQVAKETKDLQKEMFERQLEEQRHMQSTEIKIRLASGSAGQDKRDNPIIIHLSNPKTFPVTVEKVDVQLTLISPKEVLYVMLNDIPSPYTNLNEIILPKRLETGDYLTIRLVDLKHLITGIKKTDHDYVVRTEWIEEEPESWEDLLKIKIRVQDSLGRFHESSFYYTYYDPELFPQSLMRWRIRGNIYYENRRKKYEEWRQKKYSEIEEQIENLFEDGVSKEEFIHLIEKILEENQSKEEIKSLIEKWYKG